MAVVDFAVSQLTNSPGTGGTSFVVVDSYFTGAEGQVGVVCPHGQRATPANSEKVLVTAVSGTTLTVVRSIDGTGPVNAVNGYDFYLATVGENIEGVKTLADLQRAIDALPDVDEGPVRVIKLAPGLTLTDSAGSGIDIDKHLCVVDFQGSVIEPKQDSTEYDVIRVDRAAGRTRVGGGSAYFDGNASKGAMEFDYDSASGIEAGSYIVIHNGNDFVETHRIREISGSGPYTIVLCEPLRWDQTNNTSYIEVMDDPIIGSGVRNLRLDGSGNSGPDTSGIRITNAANPILQGIRTAGFEGAGVFVDSAYHPDFADLEDDGSGSADNGDRLQAIQFKLCEGGSYRDVFCIDPLQVSNCSGGTTFHYSHGFTAYGRIGSKGVNGRCLRISGCRGGWHIDQMIGIGSRSLTGIGVYNNTEDGSYGSIIAEGNYHSGVWSSGSSDGYGKNIRGGPIYARNNNVSSTAGEKDVYIHADSTGWEIAAVNPDATLHTEGLPVINGVLFRAGATDYTGDTSAHNLFSISIPAGIMGLWRALRATIGFAYQQAAGSDQNLTVTVTFGSTTVFSGIVPMPSNSEARWGRMEVLIANAGAANVNKGTCYFTASAPDADTGVGDISTNDTVRATFGSNIAEDTSSAKTFAVTITNGFNGATFALKNVLVELVG